MHLLVFEGTQLTWFTSQCARWSCYWHSVALYTQFLREYRKFFHFLFLSPMSVLTLLLLCTVQPQYLQTQSLFRLFSLSLVSSETLPAYSQRLFSFLMIESREIESADSDSGGAMHNFRVSTDVGLYLFHERIPFVVLWYCGRYHNTICK